MREAKFGLVAFSGNLKDNISALPLGLVFDKVDAAVRGMPYDFPARHELGDFVGAAMGVFVTISKLITEFVSTTFNFPRPPSTDIIDGGEDVLRSLVYRKASGVILIAHHIQLLLLPAKCLFTFGDGLPNIGLALPCSDQAMQTAFDISAPSV